MIAIGPERTEVQMSGYRVAGLTKYEAVVLRVLEAAKAKQTAYSLIPGVSYRDIERNAPGFLWDEQIHDRAAFDHGVFMLSWERDIVLRTLKAQGRIKNSHGDGWEIVL